MQKRTLPVDSQEALDRDIGPVARIGAVPCILEMICDETGLDFAADARLCGSYSCCRNS